MQATTNDLRREAAEAVNGATRTAAEASRRTIDQMQAAAQVGRRYIEDSSQVNHKLFDIWASGVEATLKAAFEMQNATYAARIAVFDTATSSTRNATQQWVVATRQVQEAALDAFRMNMRVMEQVVLGAVGAETAAK